TRLAWKTTTLRPGLWTSSTNCCPSETSATSRQSCRTYLPGGGFWERIDDSDNYRCGMALIAREDSQMMATGSCCHGDIGKARASHAADPLHCGISSPLCPVRDQARHFWPRRHGHSYPLCLQ